MGFSFANLLQLEQPEVTTVIRWLLRGVLVAFLAWLVRRKPEQEEDDEEDEDPQPEASSSRRPLANNGKSNMANTRTMARLQPRQRDPYATNTAVRQRRPVGPPGSGGGVGGGPGDFDTVIQKMSKPKEMWEVRKSGEGPPQILRSKTPQDPKEASNGGPSSAAAVLAAAVAGMHHTPSGTGSGSSGVRVPPASTGSSERVPLAVKPPSQERQKENMLHGHERPVTYITYNRDGNLLFTCGKDKIVCVWSVPEGEHLGTYKGHSGAVWSCSVTSDSRWLVTSGADRLVIVWEARTSKEVTREELPGVVRCVEWASIGSGGEGTSERFATCHNRFGSHPAAVTVWNFDGAAISQVMAITTLPTPASMVKWGRGDAVLASAHDNGELVFWNTESGKEESRLKAHDQAVSKFEFSHDCELVATASTDKSVRIWDLGGKEGGEVRQIYQVETDRPLNAVALGPFSREDAIGPPSNRPSACSVVAAGGQDARDVTTTSSTTDQFGTLLFKLGSKDDLPDELAADGVTKGHFGPVHTLAFARDGSAIASGSEDGCVRLHIFADHSSAGSRPVAAS